MFGLISSPNLGRSLYRDRRSQRKLSGNASLGTYRDLGKSCNSGYQFSRRVTVVVLQHAAKPFTALDLSGDASNFITRFDDLIAEPLMISLDMIMFDVSFDSLSHR